MEQAAVTESAFVRCLREVAPYVQCHRGSILLLPPLGYGHTGELFNLHASALAAEAPW